MNRHIKWFELVLIFFVMSVHIYAATSSPYNFANKWFTRDDAYYYFKVAQNISEGRGSTFDGINPTNGYHPLWLFICIPIFALARYDIILPLRVLLIIMAALNVATGVLLFRLISRILSEPIGILVSAFWMFNLFVHKTIIQLGLESGVTTFSIVLLLYILAEYEQEWRNRPYRLKHIMLIGFVAVIIVFSRLDTLFLVAVFGFWVIFRGSSIRYYLLFDILLLPMISFSSFLLRIGQPAYYQLASMAILMTALDLAIRIPAFYYLGLYQRPRVISNLRLFGRVILAVTISSIIISLIVLGLASFGYINNFPRSTLVLDWFLSILLIGSVRLFIQHFKPELDPQKPVDPFLQIKQNWKKWSLEGMVFFGILGGALGLYMLGNIAAFGTSSPISGQIKRWWGSLPGKVYGGPARTFHAFFGLDLDGDFNAWGLITSSIRSLYESISQWVGRFEFDRVFMTIFFMGLVLCLVILTTNRRRAIRATFQLSLLPLFVGSVLQIISYNSTGYSSPKEWYWCSQLLFTILLGTLLLDILLKAIQRLSPMMTNAIWIITALLTMGMAKTFTTVIVNRMPHGNDKPGQPYMDVLTDLEENTEPGSLIGMTGGGNVGYFIQGRTIINMDGLINSKQYFEAMKNGKASAYLEYIGLDYVFANPNIILNNLPYRGQFENRLEIGSIKYGGKILMKFLSLNTSSQ